MAGSRFHKALVFAPAQTNEGLEAIHMDYCQAALMARRSTLNGCSGNVPPASARFLGSLTPANAEALSLFRST